MITFRKPDLFEIGQHVKFSGSEFVVLGQITPGELLNQGEDALKHLPLDFEMIVLHNVKTMPFNGEINGNPEVAFARKEMWHLLEPVNSVSTISGNVCPKCHAEIKERQLFLSSFVGCLC